MPRRAPLVALAAAAACALLPVVGHASTTTGACDWTTFGHDVSHTFEAKRPCTDLTATNAATLVPKWFFHTNDSVTASPAVDGDTVYVGAWDGTFYALDREAGAVRWQYDINASDTNHSAFGRIVSSAALHDVDGTKVVVFGGGATVFVLRASDGRILASQDLDPEPTSTDTNHVAEVESSPIVLDRQGQTDIYVGLDVHNDRDNGRTGVVKLSLTHDATGAAWVLHPIWKFDPESSVPYGGVGGLTYDPGHDYGCGGVWSSPAYVPATDSIVFGTASCSYADDAKKAGQNFLESVFAIDAQTGQQRWVFHPSDDPAEAGGDFDFGASPNVFTDATGRLLVGNGRKSGDYYAFDAASGHKLWQTLAATPGYAEDGFSVGGFIGTPAVKTDANGRAESIIGASAIPIPLNWNQDDPAGQLDRSTWVARALDPVTGAVKWAYRLGGPSYAHTSVANDAVLVPETFDFRLAILDAATGLPRASLPLVGPPSSTAVSVGRDVFLGVGTRTTDVEYKTFNDELADAFAGTPLGASPLSIPSGVYRFALAG
ncbi:MAG TPA: PQQ-binding-like beta-propeller repeat protein [Acidimicrobiales bacterium]|jgi:polyvinyl alcohol dehydrogenase (cytochrome)|nr:PQQ-binding-like beta-propeller repeat protein [Acidimicrobiales bacterium]